MVKRANRLQIQYPPQNLSRVAAIKAASFQKRRERNPFIKIDARMARLAVIAIVFSLPFIKGMDIWTLGAAGAAAIACLVAVASVGYSITSFVSIVALTHLIFYPLAAWGNLLLPEPAVRWGLWVHTSLAMWGCAVGILALSWGAKLANFTYKREFSPEGQIIANPSQLRFNILVTSLVIPGSLIMAVLGVYYHGSVADYNFASQWYLNLISILLSISSCGIFLQTYRYTRTHSVKDACWAAVLCLFSMAVFLPTGMRQAVIGFLPLLVLAFSAWETNVRRKIWVWTAAFLIILILIPGIGLYRTEKNVGQLTLEQQYRSAMQTSIRQERNSKDSFRTLVGRLSDYVATGRIIADTPEIIGYRGTEGMGDWWQIYVPGFLKILPHRINLNDGAEVCDRYGVTTSSLSGGSSPVMIIGDLFSRWGWAGVSLGMVILGFILRQLDLRIFNRWTIFTIIFYVMFGRFVVTMVSSSLLSLFISLFRDLAVMVIVSYVIALFAETYFKTGKGMEKPIR